MAALKPLDRAACLYPIGLFASTHRHHSVALPLHLSPALATQAMASQCNFPASPTLLLDGLSLTLFRLCQGVESNHRSSLNMSHSQYFSRLAPLCGSPWLKKWLATLLTI